jgi:UDP-N-acetylglucosamine diphosphorylase / glucose-1-phosphate thymidylyltransferase / UDP-N-acetylgalactosamine diphosphorylase / glucosamine-1-phosphate N-acetyltransferase / galactosamine-1-phosphate N-acetyltransferase
MKIVIPMAGRGSRYADKGYDTPKPLIEVSGQPMLFWALGNLLPLDFSELIFVVLAEHEAQFGVSKLIRGHLEGKLGGKRIHVVCIPNPTEGQLCTVLAARHLINFEEALLIAASDTFIQSDLQVDIDARPPDCAGIISVIDLPGTQWSFARTNQSGRVVQVAEKERISDHASNGLYYFSRGRDLVRFGEAMVQENERVRGEFFVIPVYQKMIDSGHKILISKAKSMWDMGTPEAKNAFEAYLKQV